METTKPTNGASEPTPDAVIILAGTPQFDAFLAGRLEMINRPVREHEARHRRLQMIGEIVEVAASEDVPLMPGQILALAEAALQNPEFARDLTPAAFFSVIINKPNGREQ